MRRLLLLPAFVVAIWAIGSCPLLAQEAEASAVTAQEEEAPSAVTVEKGWSGPGFYLGLFKVLGCWLVFLLWVGTTDWISRDAQEIKLEYMRWNPIVFGVFVGAFVLVWFLPWFLVGFPLLVIAYVAPLTTYILYRNKKVHAAERVLTRDHLRHWTAARVSKFGVKVETEVQDPHESGPPVILTAWGGATDQDNNANLLTARQTPGFRDTRQLIADGLYRRSDAIMLNYTQQATGIRHLIDGVWHEDEPLEREIADPVLESLKTLCGLDSDDRQGRQEGTFAAEYQKIKYEAKLASQGTKTGERAVIQLEGEHIRFDTLDDLNMRPKMQEQLRELMNLEKGFLLFSAMPGAGLRSTVNVVLRDTDRFVREFMTFEEEKHRYEEVENVMVITYSAGRGETPMSMLPRFFLQEPNVAIIRDMIDGEMVSLMCEEINNDRVIISTVRAKDCTEALMRVLALKVPKQLFAKSISAVLNQRLIRKLCDECKEPYAPTPKILQQLRIPQGRVQAFYRPPQNPEEICPECGGIGYLGRTAIFELMVLDDTVREVLATTPNLEGLRHTARKAGMQSLQQEGIVLVAKGVTSLPELMRVLKQ